MFQVFKGTKKFLRPEAGVYEQIREAASRVSARFFHNPEGGVFVTRQDGVVIGITHLLGGILGKGGGIIRVRTSPTSVFRTASATSPSSLIGTHAKS